MNEIFAQLASQNFYARPDDLRTFFMIGMNEKAFDGEMEKRKPLSVYGEEVVTIRIEGMMLRERSFLTDIGWAVSTEEVIDEIKLALSEEKRVKLLLNTGGGLVSGTSNLADLIYENRDKIDAYATGVVASAGMWVYSAAGNRYAEATTTMGSIGVVTSVLDDENYWKSFGVVWKEIVSANAPNKRPDVKTERGQDEVKRYLTSLETVFLDSISRNLNMSREEVITNFHQGGLITGSDALNLGVIKSLTSYDMVATMPSKPMADVKIAISNLEGSYMEKTTQIDFDAVQSQLDNATASIKALEGEKQALTLGLEKVMSELGAEKSKVETLEKEALAKVEVTKEIVAMGFEHKANKETLIAMVTAGSKAEAALVLMGSKTTTGATVENTDIGEDGDDESDDQEALMAIEIAKKLSVNKR